MKIYILFYIAELHDIIKTFTHTKKICDCIFFEYKLFFLLQI